MEIHRFTFQTIVVSSWGAELLLRSRRLCLEQHECCSAALMHFCLPLDLTLCVSRCEWCKRHFVIWFEWPEHPDWDASVESNLMSRLSQINLDIIRQSEQDHRRLSLPRAFQRHVNAHSPSSTKNKLLCTPKWSLIWFTGIYCCYLLYWCCHFLAIFNLSILATTHARTLTVYKCAQSWHQSFERCWNDNGQKSESSYSCGKKKPKKCSCNNIQF